MKTLKLIILAGASAVLLYSCSNDRDEDARKEAIEHVKNSNPELKLNQKGLTAREENQAKNDTIIVKSLSGPQDPIDLIDPVDGGDPKDVPIPPRR